MMNKDANLHRPRGSLAPGRWSVNLDPPAAGWTWTSLRVLNLGPGETQQLGTAVRDARAAAGRVDGQPPDPRLPFCNTVFDEAGGA